MVYASVPAYLDPSNWNQEQQEQHRQHHHQQQQHQAGGSTAGGATGGDGDVHQILPAVPPRTEGGSMAGSAKPGSIVDRARLAKVPQPETALKCPRCDSTNTKFCYFNNYSLSQPRHFCKACRRYWTRGGALRNVPVGGGCRRNKRSKSSTGSKPSVSINHTAGTSASGAASTGIGAIGSHITPPQAQLPFLTPLHPLSEYGLTNIGLNYGGIQTIDPVDHYQVGSTGLEQWKVQQLQQFPFFSGVLDHQQQISAPPAPGLYPFDTEVGVDGETAFGDQTLGKTTTTSRLITQLASVKMEETRQGLNLSRQYLGNNGNVDHHYWGSNIGGGGGGCSSTTTTGGACWTDLSGFNSSSTGNLL